MKRILKILIGIFVLSFLFCANEKNELDVIERIIIPEKAQSLQAKIAFKQDLVITDKTSAGNYTFENIKSVIADKDGDIYVLDVGQFSILVFDSTGQYRNSFGTEGAGPGEFQDMADFHINRQGMICVYDFIGSRISLLTRSGTFWDSKRPNRTLYFMHSIDNRKFILLQEAADRTKDKLALVQTKFDSSEDIIYQGNFHKLLTTMVNDTEQPLRYGPASICTCSREGIVAHSTGKKYAIEFFGLDGKKFREIVWQDFHPLKVTKQDKQEELKYFTNFPASFVQNIAFARTKHIFKALRFDDSGNLWAIREGRNKNLYADIFDKNGQYNLNIQLPGMLNHISDKYAYVINLIESNFYIVRYRIMNNN